MCRIIIQSDLPMNVLIILFHFIANLLSQPRAVETMSTCLNIFNICICCIVSCPVVFVLHQFIKSHSMVKTPKYIFVISLFLIIVTLLCLLAWAILLSFDHQIFNGLFNILYTLQYYALLLSLFTRLSDTFRDSAAFSLSHQSIKLFQYTFICSSSTFIFFAIMEHQIRGNMLWTALVLFISAFFILSILFVNSSFIHKLFKIYQLNTQNVKMLTIITKTTVLTFTSIVTSIISPFIIIYRFHVQSLCAFSDLLITLDVFTNFLCIVLSFNHFDKFYHILCGCLDSKCKSMCTHTLKTDEFIVTDLDIKQANISPVQQAEETSPNSNDGLITAPTVMTAEVYGSHLNVPALMTKMKKLNRPSFAIPNRQIARFHRHG